MTTTLDQFAARLGLTVAEARAVATGAQPATPAAALAAPALAQAYNRRRSNPSDGPSTPQAFELGLRLRALDNGGMAERSTITPVIPAQDPQTIAALTWEKGGYQVAVHDTKPTVATRLDAKGLVDALAVPAAVAGAVLVVASPSHLNRAIEEVAELVSPGGKANAVLGALMQWRRALETPGAGLGVDVLDALGERYVTDNPSADRDLTAWCRRLRVPARQAASAVLALYRHLMPSMIELNDSERKAYLREWGELANPVDSAREGEWGMAVSLAAREALAQWLPAYRIDHDPLHAAAMRWEGRVLLGRVVKDRATRQYTVAVGHVCRLRPGAEVQVDSGDGKRPPVKVDVVASEYRPGVGIVLTLSAAGSPRRIGAMDRLVGQWVRVWPGRVSLSQALGARFTASQRRWEADKVSWLADTSKVPAGRDVPWDVMFAAAI